MNELTSINCPSCGAGNEVYGGGRILTYICTYCGSELDAENGFKLLKKAASSTKINSPLKIGMAGKIDGIEYTVIGLMEMKEIWLSNSWRWIDHYLFSPLHGYAVLTYEKDHFTLTHTVRGLGHTPTEKQIDASEYKPSISYDQKMYVYFETCDEKIEKAVGAFPWRPMIGEKRRVFSFIRKQEMLSYSFSQNEVEAELSQYLEPEAVYEGFGFDASEYGDWLPTSSKFHPLQPFKARTNERFVKFASFALAALCLFLALMLNGNSGKDLYSSNYSMNELPVEFPIEVIQTSGLVEIKFHTNIRNNWIWLEIEVTDEEDEPLLGAGKEISYYVGSDWKEGSNEGAIRFRVKEPGNYTVYVELPEAGTDTSIDSDNIWIVVSEGKTTALYMTWLFVGFFLIGLVLSLRVVFHNARINAQSDWEDD